MESSPPGSPSMGLNRQEYRSGLPFPSLGNLPDPEIKPVSPALQADCLPLSHRCCSVAQSCPTLCHPMDCGTPGLPVQIDAFELWCWRRLLRVPWTAGRSNQSILKEISPGISLEGMMLKLKLQYFGHLMGRVDSLEKTLMLGKTEGRRRSWQRMRWLDGITDSMNINLDREAWRAAVHGVTKSRTWLSDWTTTVAQW